MNQPIAINTTRKHVVWLDVVRLVAMFTVVSVSYTHLRAHET